MIKSSIYIFDNRTSIADDNPGFLGYKGNIRFLTETIPYSKICGTKVGTSYKKPGHNGMTDYTVSNSKPFDGIDAYFDAVFIGGSVLCVPNTVVG